jgi:quaternary ammonium compound-resistance protein SugE
MNWIILIIAGLCECGFTFCLGEAKAKTGLDHALWIGGFIVCIILSMALLMRAAHHLPLGTAYPVWAGIGAVGTVVIRIIVFHEPVSFWRIFFITTLILSIIGLKAVSA